MPRSMPSSTSSANSRQGQRQVVVTVELYCGSCSFARFMHSKLGWSAWYVCIDRLPQRELERTYRDWGLRAFLARPGVVYIQQDLGNLTPEKLELWCGAFTNGCAVEDVVALHASFASTAPRSLVQGHATTRRSARLGVGRSRWRRNTTCSTSSSYALLFVMFAPRYQRRSLVWRIRGQATSKSTGWCKR